MSIKEGDTLELGDWGQVAVERVTIRLRLHDGTKLTVSDWQLQGMLEDGNYKGADHDGNPLDPHVWGRGS